MHLRYARQPNQALHVLGPHAAACHDADAAARLSDQRCDGIAALCVSIIVSMICFCSSTRIASLPFTGSMPQSLRPKGCSHSAAALLRSYLQDSHIELIWPKRLGDTEKESTSPHLQGCLGPARGQDSGHATGDERFQAISLTPDHIKGSVECEIQALQGVASKLFRYALNGTQLHPSLRLLLR